MSTPAHGGGVALAARELGLLLSAILDFSASINPLGMPPAVAAAASAALAEAIHYPEIDGASLTQALARHHDLPPGHFLPGNGSSALLYLLPRVLRPRRALLVRPAFSEYGRALEQAGTRLDAFDLDPAADFRLDPAALLAQLRPDTDLVLLANPGNPSGTLLTPEVLLDLAEALAGRALLAVDEAFIDFCPAASVLHAVADHDHLYVFRSLTKFFAMPGLRAGYLAGPAAGMARLAAQAEPWALSTPALAAARACLAQDAFTRRTLAQIPSWREELAAGLAALGLRVYPAAANFLLVESPRGRPDGPALTELLRKRGILIRSCHNFPPLDRRFFRLAVRGGDDNQRLLAALAELLPPSSTAGAC